MLVKHPVNWMIGPTIGPWGGGGFLLSDFWNQSGDKPYSSWVFMGYNPQESLENTINTMGTLLGVHPIVLGTKEVPNHRAFLSFP